MNKGFTLIELLVVVLIIGILSAIALPQYTRAVERSRTAEAMQVLGDYATAQSLFIMQHGNAATSFDELNEGDIALNDAGDDWNPIAVAANGAATLTRAGGPYSGQSLTISVDGNGVITKSCDGADICALAASAGFNTPVSSAS